MFLNSVQIIEDFQGPFCFFINPKLNAKISEFSRENYANHNALKMQSKIPLIMILNTHWKSILLL